MKHIAITCAVLALLSAANAADAPPEILAARTRYEAALATASKPVRDKYVQELQQLKNRAMSMKNLELAVAIDQELKTMGAAASPTSSGPAAKPLVDFLAGTTWIAQKATKWKLIEFTSDGQLVRIPPQGKTQRSTYEAGKDADTVEFTWGDGSKATLTFKRDRREFDFDGATFKQALPK